MLPSDTKRKPPGKKLSTHDNFMDFFLVKLFLFFFQIPYENCEKIPVEVCEVVTLPNCNARNSKAIGEGKCQRVQNVKCRIADSCEENCEVVQTRVCSSGVGLPCDRCPLDCSVC